MLYYVLFTSVIKLSSLNDCHQIATLVFGSG